MDSLLNNYLDVVTNTNWTFQLFFERYWWHENNCYLEDKIGRQAEILIVENLIEIQRDYDGFIQKETDLLAGLRQRYKDKPVQPYLSFQDRFVKAGEELNSLERLWQKEETNFGYGNNDFPLNYYKVRKMFRDVNSRHSGLIYFLFDSDEFFTNFKRIKEPVIKDVEIGLGLKITTIEGGEYERVFSHNEIESKQKQSDSFEPIFHSESNYNLFLYLVEHYDNPKTPAKFSHVYHFMTGIMGEYSIGKKEYLKFIDQEYGFTISKIQPANNKYHDRAKGQLTALKSRFTADTK